jgi:hypothetical protein
MSRHVAWSRKGKHTHTVCCIRTTGSNKAFPNFLFLNLLEKGIKDPHKLHAHYRTKGSADVPSPMRECFVGRSMSHEAAEDCMLSMAAVQKSSAKSHPQPYANPMPTLNPRPYLARQVPWRPAIQVHDGEALLPFAAAFLLLSLAPTDEVVVERLQPAARETRTHGSACKRAHSAQRPRGDPRLTYLISDGALVAVHQGELMDTGNAWKEHLQATLLERGSCGWQPNRDPNSYSACQIGPTGSC